jgi:hypothetical protein
MAARANGIPQLIGVQAASLDAPQRAAAERRTGT